MEGLVPKVVFGWGEVGLWGHKGSALSMDEFLDGILNMMAIWGSD